MDADTSWLLVQVAVLVVGMTVCCGGIWAYSRVSRSGAPVEKGPGFDSNHRAAVEEIDHLQKKISALVQKVELVEEHSGEYFYVLHDHGWTQVVEVVERLELVSKEIDAWIADRRFDSALLLATFLATSGAPLTPAVAALSRHELSILENWERNVNTIIMNVATDLGNAAEDTKNLGIERAHKRKPTLMAVQEIKNLLTGRRDAKPQIKQW